MALSGKTDQTLKLLIVDDDEVSRNLLQEVLKKDGFEITLARSGEEALSLLDRAKVDLILSDIRMLEVTGLELLRVVKRIAPDTVVTLMTGFGSMEGALEAIREGAFDYISKPFKLEDLRALLQKAKRHYLGRVAPGKTPGSLPVEKLRAQGLIGKSPQIVEVYKSIARAALTSANVMISGETGTGKALVAKMIHEHSARMKGPLSSWNPEEGNEGLEKALRDAHGGIFVLEEITGLQGSVQAKILKAIEASESNDNGVRFIALTRSRLSEIDPKTVRSDLWSRFNVISIEIPPLRERMEDLPELVQYFLAKHSDRNGKKISHLSSDAMEKLGSQSWPENIRQLERAIERAVVLSRGSVLEIEDFAGLQNLKSAPGTKGSPAAVGGLSSLDAMEREHILRVLEETDYNKSRASEVLGIDRATLYRKAKQYQIELRRTKE